MKPKEVLSNLERFVQTPLSDRTIQAVHRVKSTSNCEAIWVTMNIEAGTLENLFVPDDGSQIGAVYLYIPAILLAVSQYGNNPDHIVDKPHPLDEWMTQHYDPKDDSAFITYVEKQMIFDRLVHVWGDIQLEQSGFRLLEAIIDPTTRSILSPFSKFENINPFNFRIAELGGERYKRIYIAAFGQPRL